MRDEPADRKCMPPIVGPDIAAFLSARPGIFLGIDDDGCGCAGRGGREREPGGGG